MNVAEDPTLQSLARLDDPSQWVVVKNVPLFRPHERKKKDGKLAYKVDERELGRIAARSHELYHDSGVVARIIIGHTIPDAPEEKQPRSAGFVRHMRPGSFGPRRTPALVGDLYYRKDMWPEAAKYPFRSVEYYPDRHEVSAVALLARDPELDLGMLTFTPEQLAQRFSRAIAHFDDPEFNRGRYVYSARDRCYFYAREDTMPDMPPVKKPGEEEEDEFDGMPDDHPITYGHMKRYMAKCYGPSAAGGTNTFVPGAEGGGAGIGTPPPPPPAPGGLDAPPPLPPPDSDATRMQRDSNAIRYARIQQENEQLKKERDEAQTKYQRTRCENMVTQFEGEFHPVQDKAGLVTTLLGMDENARVKVMETMRYAAHYGRAPVGGVGNRSGMVRISDDQVEGGRSSKYSREEVAEVVAYAQKNEMSFEKAMKELENQKQSA